MESRERLMASQPTSAMQQPAGRGLHPEGSELRSYSYSDNTAAPLPFAQLLANAASGGSDWKVLLLCVHTSTSGRSCHIPVLCICPGQHAAQGLCEASMCKPMQAGAQQEKMKWDCLPASGVSHCCVMLRCGCLGCRSGWRALRALLQCYHPLQQLPMWPPTLTGW